MFVISSSRSIKWGKKIAKEKCYLKFKLPAPYNTSSSSYSIYQASKSGHFFMPDPARAGPSITQARPARAGPSITQARPAQSHYTRARSGPPGPARPVGLLCSPGPAQLGPTLLISIFSTKIFMRWNSTIICIVYQNTVKNLAPCWSWVW